MNRYDYKNSIAYKKYCIKALLQIKKENILNQIRYALNILKDLVSFKSEIKEYYDLNIRLSNYMPEWCANKVYNYIKHDQNKFMNMNINNLYNTLYYINKAINAITTKINDLYYSLI